MAILCSGSTRLADGVRGFIFYFHRIPRIGVEHPKRAKQMLAEWMMMCVWVNAWYKCRKLFPGSLTSFYLVQNSFSCIYISLQPLSHPTPLLTGPHSPHLTRPLLWCKQSWYCPWNSLDEPQPPCLSDNINSDKFQGPPCVLGMAVWLPKWRVNR